MKEKCDHLLGWFWEDSNQSSSRLFIYSSDEYLGKLEESFPFCPLCGSPLRETPLDRVLWKAVNKPNPGGLFPSQRLEHAVEFLAQNWDGETYLGLFKLPSGKWEVTARAESFFSASLSKALTKALLWATTELDKETVESLIKEEES